MGTVNLAKIATTFPGNAQPSSNYKRLQRLFGQFSLDLNQVARFIAGLIPLLQFKLTLDRTIGNAVTRISITSFWESSIADLLFLYYGSL